MRAFLRELLACEDGDFFVVVLLGVCFGVLALTLLIGLDPWAPHSP